MRKTITMLAFVLMLALSAGTLAQKKTEKEKVKDPVCGLTVDKDPKLSVKHDHETHYFCSKADLEEFKKNPSKHTKKKK